MSELALFLASNLLVLLVGGTLTMLSYKAQRRLGQRNLRYTTLGFALITISSLVEAVYAPGIGGGHWLTTGQLLMLYTIESLLVGLGLASIAYSVLRH
ncbi:DUF7521 family protein [Halalkalicoccus tibetensis]|uniref:Uncharacterized protein n=1 Tax=Halalkalicoccus tibetensis TaxID=175632 RepID=A0ABD5V5E6_9EURY